MKYTSTYGVVLRNKGVSCLLLLLLILLLYHLLIKLLFLLIVLLFVFFFFSTTFFFFFFSSFSSLFYFFSFFSSSSFFFFFVFFISTTFFLTPSSSSSPSLFFLLLVLYSSLELLYRILIFKKQFIIILYSKHKYCNMLCSETSWLKFGDNFSYPQFAEDPHFLPLRRRGLLTLTLHICIYLSLGYLRKLSSAHPVLRAAVGRPVNNALRRASKEAALVQVLRFAVDSHYKVYEYSCFPCQELKRYFTSTQ